MAANLLNASDALRIAHTPPSYILALQRRFLGLIDIAVGLFVPLVIIATIVIDAGLTMWQETTVALSVAAMMVLSFWLIVRFTREYHAWAAREARRADQRAAIPFVIAFAVTVSLLQAATDALGLPTGPKLLVALGVFYLAMEGAARLVRRFTGRHPAWLMDNDDGYVVLASSLLLVALGLLLALTRLDDPASWAFSLSGFTGLLVIRGLIRVWRG